MQRALTAFKNSFDGFYNKLLIEAAADPNHGKRNGSTPCYKAAQGGHADCLRLLIAAGARVDAPAEAIPCDEDDDALLQKALATPVLPLEASCPAWSVPEFDLRHIEMHATLYHHGSHFGWHDDALGRDGVQPPRRLVRAEQARASTQSAIRPRGLEMVSM